MDVNIHHVPPTASSETMTTRLRDGPGEPEAQSLVEKTLLQLYGYAVNGNPEFESMKIDTAKDLADVYRSDARSLEAQINSLIRWQDTKAATQAFVTGLGGLLSLPLPLPAELTGLLFVQLRMIAAIAHMCGKDLRDERVQTFTLLCLAGNHAIDILKEARIDTTRQLTLSILKELSGETLRAINRAVGFQLITKGGTTSLLNPKKAFPLVGGAGGRFDMLSTIAVGNVARNRFMADMPNGKPNDSNLEFVDA
jgi:hypothetical protein